MSNFFLSANMSLVVPVVNAEIGPNWANDLNASLLILDAHNHNPGSGVQITPSGLNINTDLTFNTNNAVSLRSVRFAPQGSPIGVASDLGCLYEAGVDLYYNDGSGNQIRITQSGSVAGSAGTITGLPSGTASASYQSASGTFQFQQATSTGANIDVASVIIRYPGSYPTPAGNCIILEAPTSLSSQYSLTLPALPAQTNVMTLTSVGIISSITYDAVGQAMSSVGANAIAATMNATGANAIQVSTTRATGTTVGTGGVAVSASCGAFSTTSPGTTITNLSVTITTSGRPVMLQLIPDGTTNRCSVESTGSASALTFFVGSNVIIGNILVDTGPSFPGAFSAMDFPAAGTYNYFMGAGVIGSGAFICNRLKLVAYEL